VLKSEPAALAPAVVEEVAQMFKALSDPSRIRILHLLSQEECPVHRISEALGMSQSAVSHQLSYLRSLRLVKYRREGNAMMYSCDDSHVISLLRQAALHAEHS